MKKQNVINLIRYHVERNENAFRNEAIQIARDFDAIGDEELAEYIMGLIAEANLDSPQASDFESDLLKQIDIKDAQTLNLPSSIANDIKGVINAINHNIGINKFLFEGRPGTGKTELILSLIKELYYLNYKVLVTSNVQVACDNIVDRLKNFRNIALKRYSTIKGEKYEKEVLAKRN